MTKKKNAGDFEGTFPHWRVFAALRTVIKGVVADLIFHVDISEIAPSKHMAVELLWAKWCFSVRS